MDWTMIKVKYLGELREMIEYCDEAGLECTELMERYKRICDSIEADCGLQPPPPSFIG